MILFNKSFRISLIFLFIITIWLAACASSQIDTPSLTSKPIGAPSQLPTSTPSPIQTETPFLTLTSNIWEIQNCPVTSNVADDHIFIWNYTGDIEKRGQLDMLLHFTENNEIQGIAFDFKEMQEYRVNGCVEDRAFTMWLQQGNVIEAMIHGEFPATDPRGIYSSTSALSFDVITGSLIEKSSPESLSVYLHLSSGTAGTMEHRFELAGVKDDSIILNASQRFLNAVAKEDRAQVVMMIDFPVEVWFGGQRQQLQTPENFLIYYNAIFDNSFKERLAISFPDYLMANAGNFVGTISQSVYGGGGIVFNEYGKVIAIYNWEEESTPTPTP